MSTYLKNARDPISSLSHLLGAIFFFLGTLALVFKGLLTQASAAAVLSSLAFGFSLIALYCASAVYHYVPDGKQLIAVLRRLDHSMIYVLIAGSYTPILLHYYPSPVSVWYTLTIWGIAVFGILLRMLWFSAPRWLYTAFYIAMGWFIVLDTSALATMQPAALTLLITGGLSYTLGGVCYWLKWPKLSTRFNAHDFFHMLVLLGSLLHYAIVLLFVV